MTENEIKHYWYYFCSLCERLDNTRQYIDHSSNNNLLKNGDVNSFEFQQIIILSAMEFENICKVICQIMDNQFKMTANILDISKKVLQHFPNIGETTITSDYQILKPLKEWRIDVDPNDGKEHVAGISWWSDYSKIKHQSFWAFNRATLNNAVNTLAALMVMELYLMRQVLGSTMVAASTACRYFGSEYTPDILCANEKALPDFST